MAAWVATAAPEGWLLGKWMKKSDVVWEEQKLNQPEIVRTFNVLTGGPVTPGSTTVRLTNVDEETGSVDVLLLDTTVQVFKDGQYLGEFLGGWEGATAAPVQQAGAPLQQAGSPVQQVDAPLQQAGSPVQQVDAPLQQMGAPVQQGAPVLQAGAAMQQASAPPQRSPHAAAETHADVHMMKSAAPLKAQPHRASGGGGEGQKAAPPAKAANLDKSPAKVLALQNAVNSGNVDEVKALLAQGVDPDEPGENGKTPLLLATSKGDMAKVEALLAAGADPNAGGKNGDTPLTVAFQKGNKEILSKLFGQTFQSLGGMVTRDKGSSGAAEQADDTAPANAHDTLKEITTKLSKLGPNSGEFRPAVQHEEEQQENSYLDPTVLREQALKDKMRALAAGS